MSPVVSLGLLWSPLVSSGLPWSPAVSLGLQWSLLVSIGLPTKVEASVQGMVANGKTKVLIHVTPPQRDWGNPNSKDRTCGTDLEYMARVSCLDYPKAALTLFASFPGSVQYETKAGEDPGNEARLCNCTTLNTHTCKHTSTWSSILSVYFLYDVVYFYTTSIYQSIQLFFSTCQEQPAHESLCHVLLDVVMYCNTSSCIFIQCTVCVMFLLRTACHKLTQTFPHWDYT